MTTPPFSFPCPAPLPCQFQEGTEMDATAIGEDFQAALRDALERLQSEGHQGLVDVKRFDALLWGAFTPS